MKIKLDHEDFKWKETGKCKILAFISKVIDEAVFCQLELRDTEFISLREHPGCLALVSVGEKKRPGIHLMFAGYEIIGRLA